MAFSGIMGITETLTKHC